MAGFELLEVYIMTNITVAIDDTLLAEIQRRSEKENSTPEKIIQNILIQELNGDIEVTFEQALDYILKKNHELYKRLA